MRGSKEEMGGMGFRDLEVFNMAILAKQGWRILQNPVSLIARLLKARYFPRYTFLDASLRFQPSYTWRSLLHGREALELGTRWHVGNGTKISVFKDRWLPHPCSFRPIANPLGFTHELWVTDLIDWEAKVWDRDVILETFIPADAELVLAMCFSGEHVDDEVIWHHNKNGLFSVKSAHHTMLNHITQTDSAGTSNQQASTNLWRKIWSVRVQPRVRTLLLGACSLV